MNTAEPARREPDLPQWATLGVEGLLLLLLIAGPFCFGAVDVWGQQILLGLIAGAAALTIGGLVCRGGASLRFTWAYLPILVMLMIGVGQLIPLPAGLRTILMPGATSLRGEALTMVGMDPSGSAPISLYPLATERQLRLLIGGATLFAVVFQTFADCPRRRRRLLCSITVVGFAMTLLVLGQYAFDAQTILGLVARGHPYSGTFANHSHLGQFLNLSIGAAAALLISRLRSLRAGGMTWRGVRDAMFSDPRHWDLWLAAATITFAPLALLISMTRGGVIALGVGAIAAVLLLAATLPRRGVDRSARDMPVIGLLAGAAVLLIAVAVGFTAAYDRMASLRDVHVSSNGRLDMLRDALNVWGSAPYLGTGLGTHAFVSPAFDRSTLGGWASHAENEYAQLLEETGVLGLAAVVFFIGIVLTAIVRGTMRLRSAVGAGASIADRPELALPGLALGLAAVAWHSTTDFGQHLPAIGFLTAILSGLTLATVRAGADTAPQPLTTPRHVVRQAAVVVVGIALVVATAWIAPGLARDRRAESAFWRATLRRVELDANGWSIVRPAYRELLIDAMAARDAQPRDVEYAFWLNAWRYEAIAQQAGPDAAPLDPQLTGWARTMVSELLATVRECPTFGRPMALAGQLLAQMPSDNAISTAHAQGLIIRGAQLAPYDPMACFAAGRLLGRGNPEQARALLQRAAGAASLRLPTMDVLVRELDDVPTARDLAGDDLVGIDHLIDLLSTRPHDSATRADLISVRDQRIASLASDSASDAITLDDVARRYSAAGALGEAIRVLQRAAALDYGNVDRRLRLAALLVEAGHLDAAIEQLTIASRIRPGDQALREQIQYLQVAQRRQAATQRTEDSP